MNWLKRVIYIINTPKSLPQCDWDMWVEAYRQGRESMRDDVQVKCKNFGNTGDVIWDAIRSIK
jgi:hypothetical protein